MKKAVGILFLMLVISVLLFAGSRQVNVFGISDYHSHSLPFYSEGKQDVAGVARILGFLKEHCSDENTLVFSSGDTINYGSPAWSDKYMCIEWPWFNNIIDAMAYGNHDSDYGPEVFAKAVDTITYPILSANTVDAEGNPIFLVDGKNYMIFERNGLKIGVFALAGGDFEGLIKAEHRPVEGAVFTDRYEAAEKAISQMKSENTDLIILIGHSTTDNDIDLAKKVEGIDLILGSHSHLKQELVKIDGTDTYIISPFQYGTYVSNVVITVNENGEKFFEGKLIPMTSDIAEDKIVKSKVLRLQKMLENDPEYANLFENIGEAAVEISVDGQGYGEAGLGNLVTDLMRESVKSNMALSTSSSFRASIAPGKVNYEQLKTAIPYTNYIFIYDMTGEQIKKLLEVSFAKIGSDNFSQVSGVMITTENGKIKEIDILKNALNPKDGYEPLDMNKVYKVATTNYQGLYAADYKDVFAPCAFEKTNIDVQLITREHFESSSPVYGGKDGRIK